MILAGSFRQFLSRRDWLAGAGLTLLLAGGGLFALGLLGQVLAFMFFQEPDSLARLLPWVWLSSILSAAVFLAGCARALRTENAALVALPSFLGLLSALAWMGLLAAGSFFPFGLFKEDPSRGMDLAAREDGRWGLLISTFLEQPLEAVWPDHNPHLLPPGIVMDGPVRRHEGEEAVKALCEPRGVDTRTFRKVRKVWIASMNDGTWRLFAYEKCGGTHIEILCRLDRANSDPAGKRAMMDWFQRQISARRR